VKIRLFYILFLLILVSCKDGGDAVEATSGQALVSYAKGFKVFEFDTAYALVIGNSRYTFPKKINHPTFIVSSVTQLQFLKALKIDSAVLGVFDANYFTDSAITDRLNKKQVLNFKQPGSPDWELLIKYSKCVVLGYRHFNIDEIMAKKLNLSIVPINEYEEDHPLGKSEWLKVFGVISGQYHLADSLFKIIENRYLTMKPVESDTMIRPKVIAGDYYDGVWTVPGTNSYIASLVRDAGGDYILKNEKKSIVMMNKETFSSLLTSAHYWRKLTPNKWDKTSLSKDEIQSLFHVHPERLKGIIYCDVSKVNYFDAVLLHPEKELQDFINAFQNKDTMNFYRLIKVERD